MGDSSIEQNIITGDPLGLWEQHPPEWQEYRLWDIAEYINGRAFKPTDFSSVGLSVIKITELKNGLSPATSLYNGEYEEKYILETGDLLFAWSGNPETSLDAFRWKGSKSLLNQHIFRVIPHNNIDKTYLFFLLKYLRPTFIRTARDKATSMGHVKISDLKRLVAFIPPLSEQKAIASILGALDDKIELNRKMNETLEAMARAIFKSWFVGFDPIPSLGHHKEWQDSPLGMIPKGWRVDNLNEIVELHRDSINPISFPNEIFEHYSIPAFDDGQMPTYDLGSTIKSNKFLLPDKCILISKLNPRIPRIWFPKINKYRRAVASTEFLVLVPKPPYNSEFIYSLCVSASFWDTFTSLVTGTSSSHQRVKSEDLLTIKIVCPSGVELKVFLEKVESVFKHIQSNKEQSHTLASVRDALLPKLLSGEIRVKGAEAITCK